jgi:hypothetical protein
MPAMTEYDVELNWRRGAAERQQRDFHGGL